MLIQWYPGHMAKARRQLTESLKLIDVVVEIVDARAPRATRNPDFDGLFKDKKRVVLLNKSDLASPALTKAWITEYKKNGIESIEFVATNSAKKKAALELMENAAKEKVEKSLAKGVKKTVRAMIVGIPNVGKSTFINSFAGAARAKAANKPGVTRGKQWITVDDYDLMDMPGVLWKKFDSLETATNLAFIGSIKDDILDIEELACGLLSGVRAIYPQRLMERYKLDEQALALPPYDLLQAIGAKRGMLISGGEVNTERAAIMLVDEFRACKWGRISLERPRQRAEVTDWEGDDADEDEQ